MIYLEILAEDGTGWRIPIPASYLRIQGGKAELVKPLWFTPDQACKFFKGRLSRDGSVPGEYDILIEDMELNLPSRSLGKNSPTSIDILTITCDNPAVVRLLLT